jgi:hypothetical protein
VDTSTHHLSAFGHHVTIGTGFPIYEGGEEGLLPSVNILRFHRSTLASIIQTTFSKVSTDLIPAAPLWLRDTRSMTPALTNGSTRGSTRTSRSALTHAFIRHDGDVDEVKDDDGFISDCDETKGPEREAAIRSPPKGKKRVTSSVSNKPLLFGPLNLYSQLLSVWFLEYRQSQGSQAANQRLGQQEANK